MFSNGLLWVEMAFLTGILMVAARDAGFGEQCDALMEIMMDYMSSAYEVMRTHAHLNEYYLEHPGGGAAVL